MSESDTYAEFGAAYVEEKFKAAQRAAKSLVKNLSLIEAEDKVIRVEYEEQVYDVKIKAVVVEDVVLG